jgi:hypothetical protein
MLKEADSVYRDVDIHRESITTLQEIHGNLNFPKVLEPIQNSRRQKGDMKQVPHWGPTNIGRYRTKLRGPGHLAPRAFAHLH